MEEEKLVIFDLDGTLYQTELVSIAATKKAFNDMNLSIPDEEVVMKHFGEMTENFCKSIYPAGSCSEWEKLAKLIGNYEKTLIPELGKLYEGIEVILEELYERNYKIAICSNGSLEYINLVLTSTGIKKYFSVIKSNKNIKSKEKIIKDLLAYFNTNRAIVIGDTVYDVQAGQDNKLSCIQALYGYGKKDHISSCYIANDSKEIRGHINRIEIFWEIEKEIRSNNNGKNYLLGINGVDNSGKTKFTSLLKRHMKSRGYKVEVINLDDFHNSSDIRSKGKNEIEAYINNAFNLKLLEQELLIPLNRNNIVNKKLKLLDFSTDTYTKEKNYCIDKGTIVILEGVLLYRDPIDKYFDYRIFLDIPFFEVISRAKKRDVPLYGEEFIKKYYEKYIPLQKRYIKEYKPIEKSDLVINNTDYNNPKIKK